MTENRPRRLATVVAVLTAAAAAALPASASAASTFTCEASAIRAQVLTAPAVEPIVANRGQACKTATAGVPTITGLPVSASARVLSAQTSLAGSDAQPGSQKVGAAGGLADLAIGLPTLPITLPVDQLPAALDQITVTPPAIPAVPGLPGIPGVPAIPGGTPIQIPLGSLIKTLLPNGALPTELLGVRGAFSTATASCVNGAVRLDGSSQVAGLRVLNQELPTDKLVSQTLNVIGGGTVDPSQLKPAEIIAATPALAALAPAVQAAVIPLIQARLDELPKVPIPAQVAELTVKPAEQIREGSKLTQRALRVSLAIAGQSIFDVALGEASVSAANVPCTAASQVADEQLSCTKKRLALVDVLRRGNRVRLFGVADKALVGKQVTIRFTADNSVVGRPTVKKDGTFETSGPLPRASIRDTNRARYIASVGKEKSLELKLARRMVVTQLTSKNGKVTIAGRVIRPLGSPVQTIVVQRFVSCSKRQVVARIKPSRSGAFRVTVDAPPKSLAATYRLTTKVRKTTSNPKLFDTYTLPRAVEVD